ncbi:MAG: phosphotransferase [Deltaproteobacteria bacterium]
MDEVASVEHLTPEAAIARISDWEGLEVAFETLGGGITNHNYVVTVSGRPDLPWGGKYVMRIPGRGTDYFIDREREHRNAVAAAEAGVTPPILYLLEPEMCTVVPFIEGETMHPEDLAGHPDRLEKVVDIMKAYHEKATFANEIHVFDMIREYLEMARGVDARFPDDMDWMLGLGDRIEQAMQRDKPAPVACHCDLLSENFILEPGGRMWVIDWEYGGMADPYFDLGDFCVEHPLSDDEERFIITRYCGSFREELYTRMMLHKIVADLWWSIWAWIQVRLSKIDFDFQDYGMNRVARLRANAARPEFESWLATV